jgi:hypothetical protein
VVVDLLALVREKELQVNLEDRRLKMISSRPSGLVLQQRKRMMTKSCLLLKLE